MRVGVGLPSTIPNVSGKFVLEWAKKAEELGFSSLGTIDRIVYQNYESMIALAAAAAVTQKIGLMTTVLVSPTRDTGLFAKQVASLDRISGGRVTLGVGVGGRRDDADATQSSFSTRGRRLGAQLSLMRKIWAGEKFGDSVGTIGPAPAQKGGPTILIGGRVPRAVSRIGKWGDGYIGSGMDSKTASSTFKIAQDSWAKHNRDGKPKLVCCFYYALGDSPERGADYLRHYYAFAGQFAENIAKGMLSSGPQMKDVADSFSAIDANEIIMWPCIADINQLNLLAESLSSYLRS
ncbi:MAG: LLM class flavin-dependent oxidoreductase [Nitrososphaerales archaeon]